ncbi:MAG: hypothetical protein Q9177_004020 [Variospora cf. flavescens]
MSILTLLAPLPLRHSLNIPHCTFLALVHDMAESLVGDLTPLDNVPKPEKSRRERTTMTFLTSSLLAAPSTNVGDAGAQINAAWEEYEAADTLESKFVHDVDKLELLLQMVEYERRGEGSVDLGEFVHVAKGIQLGEMKVWCREVLRERRAFWEGKGIVPSHVGDVEKILAEEEKEKEK